MASALIADTLPNSLGLACRADNVVRARTDEQVLEAADWAQDQGLPLLVLGGASNVVLPARIAAPVVYCEDNSVSVTETGGHEVLLRIGAGKNWHDLVLETVAAGYFGLENLALIPGNVGAAPVQNIGAYGRELSAFVECVHGVDLQELQVQSLVASECEFGYRDSVFKHHLQDRFVITAVELRLSKVPALHTDYPSLAATLGRSKTASTPQRVCDAVIEVRSARLPDPREEPNAGSFFKNPLVSRAAVEDLHSTHPDMPAHVQENGDFKLSAAWLIEHSGLRGYRQGPAAMSDRHALVLVNLGKATQEDVLKLAAHVIDTVKQRFDVQLLVEPRIYTGV